MAIARTTGLLLDVEMSTHGLPEEPWDQQAVAIDIYNNDLFMMCDDFVEADGGVHNIRVMRNRGFNAGQCGLSGQPVYGGPAYYIRNVMYHVPQGVAFKWFVNPAGLVAEAHNRFSVGPNSGEPIVTTPLQLGTGRTLSGSLELSNVDLAREFIGLITASTGFSAASRVITTADELLNALLMVTR